jgi:hypothetical protein
MFSAAHGADGAIWSTERFDAGDLKRAKALLDEQTS